MSEFHVGQKVVYVGGNTLRGRIASRREVGDIAVIDMVYTIRWVGIKSFIALDGNSVTDKPACRVVELHRNTQHPTKLDDITRDVAFAQIVFRPLQTKAIDLFRQIARDVTEGKKVKIHGKV